MALLSIGCWDDPTVLAEITWDGQTSETLTVYACTPDDLSLADCDDTGLATGGSPWTVAIFVEGGAGEVRIAVQPSGSTIGCRSTTITLADTPVDLDVNLDSLSASCDPASACTPLSTDCL